MKKLLLLLIVVLTIKTVLTQPITKADYGVLQKMEKELQQSSRQMIFEEDASKRFMADSIFIRTLVKALKVSYSFNYPFDSIVTVSKLYAPDSSFRIFTWQFQKDESKFRQRGAIQMYTEDGSLKLFPLIDMSDFTNKPTDSLRSINNWIGAIYYNILLKEHNSKKYYTLFGFDDNSLSTTKKWIDILTFDEKGNPQFGNNMFVYKNDVLKPQQPAYRFCLEYKKDGRARLNYDAELDLIVFDHLISESNEPQKAFTLVPDGDYEAFRWLNGQWIHVDKLFTEKLEDGQAPIPHPIKDDSGKSDEKKLLEQSEKNRLKEIKSKEKKNNP